MAKPSHFDLQPTLTGELIELRPLLPDDHDALFQAASDPLIWAQHPESDRHQPQQFKKYFDSGIESGGALAVIERASGKIIGSSRYWNLQPEKSEVEIGWSFLQRSFWGGTYNRELKQLMIGHAFRFVEHVVFIAGENNLRSQKALQKIGAHFVSKCERPGSSGEVKMNVVFRIDRKDWQMKNKS